MNELSINEIRKTNLKFNNKLIKNKSLLKKRLSEIPKLAGCYLFKDNDGNLLYVGKSKKLRTRVSSYFNNYADLTPRLSLMVRQITEIEVIITDSEYEALNLESNLIKTNKPYFNILLTDDKKYPYICITWSEKYPRIYITRRRRNRKNRDRYYGPYVDVGLLRNTLYAIKKIFPLRQRPRPVYKNKTCLNYSIGRCPGVCQELVSSEEYKKTIKQISMIFQGRNDDLLNLLEAKMKFYSDELQYEKAAKTRDQIFGIKKLLVESQKISIPDSSINRDIFGIASNNKISSVQIFQMRSGKLVGRIGYIQKINESTEGQILQKILEEHYINVDAVEIPNEILIQNILKDNFTIEEWLSDLKKKKVKLTIPKRHKKLEMINLVLKNAKLELDRISNGIKDNEDSIEDLTQILDLQTPPKRIEGYDISHIQGSDPVASQVVFIDGIPSKQNYRKYKINNSNVFVGHSDDFASIEEVIYRRFKKWSRFKKEGGDFSLLDKKESKLNNELLSDWPDLIMIDGGKGQLKAAIKSLKNLDLEEEVNICSLAKRAEEIFIPGIKKPLETDKNQKGVLLLRRVRDEAHRFALTFHKNKRSSRMKRSQLSEIPGVGPNRIRVLLDHFKSIEALRLATLEEISNVKGLGKNTSYDIYNYFHEL